MPATNYTWSIDDKPIFQVYGTKRKTPCSQNDETMGTEEESEMKRRCMGSRPCPEGGNIDCMEMLPSANESHLDCVSNPAIIQQTELSMISINHQHHHLSNMPPFNNRVPPLPETVHDCNVGMDMTGYHFNNNNNNNISQPGHTNQQHQMAQQGLHGEMIMDLNDEVYTTTSWPLNPQTDAEYEAACNMVAAMESEGAPDPYQYKLPQPNPQSVGGPLTPGKVLHTWQSSQDMRPYVSDYY